MRETKGGWESKKATAADQSKNGMLEPWLQSKGLSDAKSRQQLQLAVAVWATIQVASYIVLLCFHVFFLFSEKLILLLLFGLSEIDFIVMLLFCEVF
jgi:hypothetical protein